MNTATRWAYGLAATTITGAAHAIPVCIVDPSTFNLHEGLSRVATVALLSGLISAAAFLAKSPLPPDDSDPPAPAAVRLNPAAAALTIGTLLLAGCAGTAIDQDFRRKVQSDTTTLQANSRADGSAGLTLTNSVVFRDPDATGLRK